MAFLGTLMPTQPKVPLDPDLEHLAFDEKLTAKLMRKRQEEAQRRAKLLDPRKRMLGIDPTVLDQQVAEKKAAAEAEAASQTVWVAQQALHEQVMQTVEDMQFAAVRERQKAALEFSLQHLRKEQRREYALSDPTSLRRELPPGANGEILGPCAMQTFEGQSRGSLERKRELQQLQAQWLREQAAEKVARAEAEKELDRRFEAEAAFANQVRECCEEAELEEQKAAKIAEVEENKHLAEVMRQRRQAQHQREMEINERHSDTIVHNSCYRVKPDTFANFKPLVKKDHTEARKRAEAEIKAQEAAHAAAVSAVLEAVEQEKVRMVQERRLKMNEINETLAAAKHQKDVEERRTYRSFEFQP